MPDNEKILNALRIFTLVFTSIILRDIFKIKNLALSSLIGGGVLMVGGALYYFSKTKKAKAQIIYTSFYCVAIFAVAFFFIRGNDDINSESKITTKTVNDVTIKESEYQRLIGKWKVTSESRTGMEYLFITDDSLKIQTNKGISSYLYANIPNWITTYKNDSIRFVWYIKEVTDQNLVLTIDKSEVRFTKE
jgi:hypothetical protein